MFRLFEIKALICFTTTVFTKAARFFTISQNGCSLKLDTTYLISMLLCWLLILSFIDRNSHDDSSLCVLCRLAMLDIFNLSHKSSCDLLSNYNWNILNVWVLKHCCIFPYYTHQCHQQNKGIVHSRTMGNCLLGLTLFGDLFLVEI